MQPLIHQIKTEKMKKLRTLDFSYFVGKNYFDDDGSQHYLVFQPLFMSFATTTGSDSILAWKFKGVAEGSIKPPATSD